MAADGGRSGTKPSLRAQDTFADLFLKGYSGETVVESASIEIDEGQQAVIDKALTRAHYFKTISDPPGWEKSFSSSAVARKADPATKQDVIDWKKRQEEVYSHYLLQTMVQDYWKEQVLQPLASTTCPLAEECTAWQTPFLMDCGHVSRRANEDSKYRPYVVMVLQPVGLRSSPTLDIDEQCGNVLCPGECFVSSCRVAAEGTRFMRLMRGNWVFENMEGQRVVASLDDLELGPWWYRNVCGQLVEVRRVPSRGNWARSGYIICPNEACVVTLRCRVDGDRYLLLADGRGWIFEKYPVGGNDAEEEDFVLAECDVPPSREPPPEIAMAEGKLVKPRAQPLQTGSWVYQILDQPVLALGTRLTGVVLEPGEQVVVNARIAASGKKTAEVRISYLGKPDITSRMWLRLSDGRGWIPKVDEDGQALVQFIKGGDGHCEPDISFQSNADQLGGSQDWRVGVA